MVKNLLLIISFLYTSINFAQPTWSEDAAEVFYNNCTECHNPDGIGNFSLLDYESAFDYKSLIQSYVEANIMPPWTADSSFQHYFGERLLTDYERNIIIDWANEGALEGDPALAPPAPVYSSDHILPGTPDLVIEMPLYMSKATELQDDYICLSLPTGLLEDKKVKAIEVIPGNRSIVHHCLVYADADGTYETDTIGGDCGGPTSEAILMTGYTPGATPTIFPSNADFSSGMVLDAGSNVIFAMHYPHGSYGEYDQTKVNFYFYDEPVASFREILAAPVLQNWEFELSPDVYTPVSAAYETTPIDLTILSVFPHMHLLGKSIEAYGITPAEDTVKFIRIPEWDFDWQDFYWFKYMQKLPAESNMYANGVFDNTVANPHNPHDPPITVNPGFNTTDEMFLVYFHFMGYQAGDENINVDSLNTVFLGQNDYTIEEEGQVKVYPNPFNNQTAIEYAVNQNSFVSVYVYDVNGKIVSKLRRENQSAGTHVVNWNGQNDGGKTVPNGIYFYSILIDGQPYSGKIIKQ
jgi:hypothetical protein